MHFGIPQLIIPSEIAFNPNITANEKLLFGFLMYRSKIDTSVESLEFISSFLGITNQTVLKSLENLRKHKYIIKEINKKYSFYVIDKNYPKTHKNISGYANNQFIEGKNINKKKAKQIADESIEQ